MKFSLPPSLTLNPLPPNVGIMGNMLEQLHISVGLLTTTNTWNWLYSASLNKAEMIYTILGLHYGFGNLRAVILMGLSLGKDLLELSPGISASEGFLNHCIPFSVFS